MDDEIARVYADNGIEDLKPTWVLEIVRLHARGPMTIAELARSVGRTHSALSQKVAAMRAAGWLETTPGARRPQQAVTLTPKAERVAALLAAEWRATEAAITELEAELPYPLTQVAEDIRAALARKSFHDRITEKLSATRTGPQGSARQRHPVPSGCARQPQSVQSRCGSGTPQRRRCSCASCRPAASPWGYRNTLPGNTTVASVSLFQFTYQPGLSRLSAKSRARAAASVAGASNSISVHKGGW